MAEVERRTTAAGRLAGVDALGVDEHVWTHTGSRGPEWSPSSSTTPATGAVSSTLGSWILVKGRSGKTYADWLTAPEFRAGIKTATLDAFRGYANAIRDELPDAIQVLGAFHIVKLASTMVDEVRRGVQQDTLGHRGRTGDPLRGPADPAVRGPASERETARLDATLEAGDPNHEVTVAWQCYQQVR
ncbi:transposase [Arthrobacter sp. UYCu712]|uniref:transposase n=1 Tax=Arthrobacter sp. UYCu712 TaxID=3156340 RepID=UPI003390F63F